jgi:two-component system, sensor histidine kinase PdtaS
LFRLTIDGENWGNLHFYGANGFQYSLTNLTILVTHFLIIVMTHYLKHIGVCLTLFINSFEISGQPINRQMYNGLIEKLRTSKPGTDKINTLIELGKFHIYKPGELKTDLDSGLFYLRQAKELSVSLQSVKWQNESNIMLVIYEMESSDTNSGRLHYEELIAGFIKAGHKAALAEMLMRMGNWLSMDGSKYEEVLANYQKAAALFTEIKDYQNTIRVLKDQAYIHITQSKLDIAEAELNEALVLCKQINYPKQHYIFNLLSTISRIKGDYKKALLYSLQCIESMNNTMDTVSAAHFYQDLARIYVEIGNRAKAIEWYKKSIEQWKQEKLGNFAMFITASYLVDDLLEKNKIKEAFSFIKLLVTDIPPVSLIQKACVAQIMARCHNSAGNYKEAEAKFVEALDYYKEAGMDFEVSQEAQYEIGKFYVDQRLFQKGDIYLTKALSFNPQKNSLAVIKDIHLMLYKVDSARGDYIAALEHFRVHKKLSDSLFNTIKSRQIEELQIQYETAGKQQNIDLLNAKTSLQQAQLKKASLTSQIIISGALILVVFSVVVLHQYRLKQKAHIKISSQNFELNQLLDEKEWLLKEVHHRVKNNLQTVISLLESQSAYLEDDALAAIQNSQHRIYAMSLIHQKLYHNDNIASINMGSYLPELINYLTASFDTIQRIFFVTNIEDIQLDVSQAIPVGLIINEAVTNAIKYAFAGGNHGVINIELVRSDKNELTLSVSDNGAGMPYNWQDLQKNSLGLRLMKGLTEDINGSFELKSLQGTTIKVTFPEMSILRKKMQRNITEINTALT